MDLVSLLLSWILELARVLELEKNVIRQIGAERLRECEQENKDKYDTSLILEYDSDIVRNVDLFDTYGRIAAVSIGPLARSFLEIWYVPSAQLACD